MRTTVPVVYFIAVLSAVYEGAVSTLTPTQRRDINVMLQQDQSKPPFYHTGNQTNIRISLHMTEMRFVKNMEADFTFYYYQIWEDSRLEYPFGNHSDYGMADYHVVQSRYFGNVWLAESYIENELHSRVHDSSMPNRFVWLLPNGTIVYSLRMTVGVSCNLRGVLFPNGLFVCLLKFRIHSYRKKEVSLTWDTFFHSEINTDFDREDVTMEKWQRTECSTDFSSVVDSSCLEVRLNVKVSFASTVVRIYMPSVFIVMVGWLSFWVERSEVSARIKLGTLTMLAMITEQVGTKFFLPIEFNVNSMEVWYITSLAFVVVAMFEYTFVHAVDAFQEKVKRQADERGTSYTTTEGSTDPIHVNQGSNVDLVDMTDMSKGGTNNGRSTTDKEDLMNIFGAKYIVMISTGQIEKYFRILYAVAYLVFQFLFWVICLNYEEKHD